MVLNQPLVFIVPQPVSKILHSFLVQNVSIFSEEFISEEISGARALPRALREHIFPAFELKIAKNSEKMSFCQL